MRKFTLSQECPVCKTGWIKKKWVRKGKLFWVCGECGGDTGVELDSPRGKCLDCKKEDWLTVPLRGYLKVWCHSCGFPLPPMQCAPLKEETEDIPPNGPPLYPDTTGKPAAVRIPSEDSEK